MKIAHIADCHLRQRQYNSPQRGEDFLNGLKSAIKTAHDNGCNHILVSGDLLDSTNPGSAVCIHQLDSLQDFLVKLQMKLVTTDGNHDKTNPSWCSRFNRQSEKLGYGIFEINNKSITLTEGKVSVTVHGLPYMSDETLRSMLKEDSIPHTDILMWHGAIKEFIGYPTENTISMSELTKDKRWKLIAMGDQHVHKMLTDNGVTVAYSGSTELCKLNEDLEKKMWIYDWDEAGTFKYTSVSFDTRKKQLFVLKTEEEFAAALKTFDPNAILFVTYSTEIQNAALRLQMAVKETNILRTVPLYPSTINVLSIKDNNIGDIVQFLREHIKELVDSEVAARIENLCVSVLSQDIDFMADINKYCEDKLGTNIV